MFLCLQARQDLMSGYTSQLTLAGSTIQTDKKSKNLPLLNKRIDFDPEFYRLHSYACPKTGSEPFLCFASTCFYVVMPALYFRQDYIYASARRIYILPAFF